MNKHNHFHIYALCIVYLLFCNTSLAQTTANFTSPIDAGCAPLAVNLQDASNSNATITDWSWSINGDFLSNEQNPTALLTLPGFYDICLTITASDGTSDQECKNNFLEVFVNPQVSFTADVVSGCSPLIVNFTNTSVAGSGAITSVTWDFGGSCGIVSANPGETVSCTYTNPGDFQVTLLAEDANGCIGSSTIPGFIEVLATPIIDVVINPFDNCQLPILVDVANNGNPGDPISYNWDFGNGNTSTMFDPAPVSFNGVGPFVISVDALNTQTNCSSDLTLSPPIEELSPLSFSFSRTSDCSFPEVAFVDNSPGVPDAVSWDFGDGGSSSLSSPVHLFSGFGCFNVTMTRTLGTCIKSLTQQVCVEEIDPATLNFNLANTQSCVLPHSANYFVAANANLDFLWDFGDAATSANSTGNHVYTSFGDYPVTLTVTDDIGCSAVIEAGLIEVQPLSIQLDSLDDSGCAPLTITENPFINSFSTITSINWEVTDAGGAVVLTSNLENPTFTFTNVGCYSVSINATNQEGCSFSQNWIDLYCAGNGPTANFSFTPTSGCASEPFNFTDLSSGNVDGWHWDFEGDGIIDDITQNPSYEFGDVDCFNPVLTAFSFGCPNTITLGPICIEPPVADFEVVYNCDMPTFVSFINAAEGADSLAWDFGVAGTTNDTSSLLNPNFSFPSLGDYDVVQIAYNFSTGCSDTALITVTLEQPQASFTIPQNQYCLPATVPFTNTSIGGTSFEWTIIRNNEVLVVIGANNPLYAFELPGTYSVQLEIANDNACTNIFVIDNIEVGAPEAGFDFSLSGDCVPFDLILQDTSSNFNNTNTAWAWDIGNGIFTGTGENFQMAFDTAGLFEIELIVSDDAGCQDTVVQSIGLNESAPVAMFNGLLFGCDEVDIEFNDLSIGSGLSYAWDFGNGTTSTDPSPIHNFTDGAYEVCLSVADNMCSNTFCDSVFIQDVSAQFNVDPNYSGCNPSAVDFVNNSQNAESYLWDFGDGSGESNSPIASHIYPDEGVYDVELIAYGANPGCTDTLFLAEEVSILGPGGMVDFDIDGFCLPSNFTVVASTDRPYDITVFYGDGNSDELMNVTSGNFSHTYESTTNDGFLPSVLLVESNNAQCFTTVDAPDTLFLASLEIAYTTDQEILCDSVRDVFFESNITSSAPYSVAWEFENGNPSTSNSEDVLVNYAAVGINDVNFYVDNGICQDTILANSLIEVYDDANLQSMDVEVCFGDSVQLIGNGAFEYIYWDNVHLLTNDTIPNPLAFPEETTTFTATAGFSICPSVTATATVLVNAIPVLEVDPTVVYFPGEEVTLGPEDAPASGFSYSWSPPEGLSCNNCANPFYTLDSTGIYNLTYTLDSTGCRNEIEVMVSQFTACPPRALTMPNVFSPNDDGNNDHLFVFADLVEEVESIRIFDRWGSVVFQTSEKTDRWDGRLNGKFVNPGVYIYLVEYICPIDGELVRIKGDVTVLR